MDVPPFATAGPKVDVPAPIVFIVDDDAAIRQAISALVSAAGLAETAFRSAQSFLDYYDGRRPGCLVLDIGMSGMNGLELQRMLNLREVRPPIIFITGHGEIPLITQAIREGAIDVIPK